MENKLNKKGTVAGFIIMIVLLVVGLIGYIILMPVASPFIDSVKGGGYDPLTTFLFMGIPLFLVIAIIIGTVMS